MRALLRVCALLAAGIVPGVALGASPADGPGCLGVTAETCVAWLRSTMNLNEGLIASAMARRHRVDVNGKPLGGGVLSLSGKLPGRSEWMLLVLHLRPDDTVASIEANLLLNLIDAHTEHAYDQSGFYDIVSRLLGRRCPGLVKLELYRFFENAVKPRIKYEKQDLAGGLYGVHRLQSYAEGVPYCGVSFGYTNFVEWRGSAEPHAGPGLIGYSSIRLQ